MSSCPHCGRPLPKHRGPRTVAQPIPCGSVFLGFTGQQETCIMALNHAGPCESVGTLTREVKR